MKKTVFLALMTLAAITLFTGCTKRDYYDDHSSWLSQERGRVVYASDYCEYFIVDLGDTYAVMQSLDNKIDWPYPDDYIYGNFKNADNVSRQFYNKNSDGNYILRARIKEFINSYQVAERAVKQEYCGGAYSSGMPAKVSRSQATSVAP